MVYPISESKDVLSFLSDSKFDFELPFDDAKQNTRNKTQPTNTLTMTTALCFDVMEMIGEKVVEERQIREQKRWFLYVLGELKYAIRQSDEYARENTEGESDEDYVWDGTRFGNAEWEYAFWSFLDH
jgi:hypothetical protein